MAEVNIYVLTVRVKKQSERTTMLDRQKEKTLILFSIYARDENVI